MDQQQNGEQFFKQQISTMTRLESACKKQAASIEKYMLNSNNSDRQYVKNQQYTTNNFNKYSERPINYYNNNNQNTHKYYENNVQRFQNNQNFNFSKGNGRERRYDHQYNNAYSNHNKEYLQYSNGSKAYQKRDYVKKIRYKQKVIVNDRESQEISIKKIEETDTSEKESDINIQEIENNDEYKCQNVKENSSLQPEIIVLTNTTETNQPEQQCLQIKIDLNPAKKLIKAKQQKKFINEEHLQKYPQISISKSWQVDYEASLTQNMELNLTRQANQFLQYFDNWQKFQDYPLKTIWINFSTSEYVNEVKILSLFIVPMKEDIKLIEQPSRFYELINSKFQFPKKQYRQHEVTSELCKLRIPSHRNHELNDAILREMVEIRYVRIKCTNCQSKNVLQLKERKHSAISCKKCSGRMEISFNSLTFYQPK